MIVESTLYMVQRSFDVEIQVNKRVGCFVRNKMKLYI